MTRSYENVRCGQVSLAERDFGRSCTPSAMATVGGCAEGPAAVP